MSYPLLVFSTPRSGSTLLMRLLNASTTLDGQGITIRGEIVSLTGHFLATYREIKDVINKTQPITRDDVESSANFHPFFHENNFATAASACRNLLKILVAAPEGHVWGLKDVRAGVWDVGAFNDSIKCLKEILPESKIIFNTRSIEEAAASVLKTGWWGRDANKIRSDLAKQISNFSQVPCDAKTTYKELLDWEQFNTAILPLSISITESEHARIIAHKIS